jgi:hypothetical protein
LRSQPSRSIVDATTAVLPLEFRQEPREDDAVVLIVVGPAGLLRLVVHHDRGR